MNINTIEEPIQSINKINNVLPKSSMKALIYQGVGKVELKHVPRPVLIKATDVIVKMQKTTICGTDLGILKGKDPSIQPGITLGHEGVGVIDEIGSAVNKFKVGDAVIISCITSDGICEYCKKQMYSHCEDGGWILGNKINGTQAEYVRIPHADHSLYPVPEKANKEALVMLSDILPTGFEIGVLNGCIKPGDIVAIVGAGPVGMAALLTAKFFSPAKIFMIDVDENRLKLAMEAGATDIINSAKEDVTKRIMNDTKDGVDVSIEAVGIPATFDICQNIIRPGGHVANIGVHGHSVVLNIEKLWMQNITLTTGLVNTNTIPMLLKTVLSNKLDPAKLITHHFDFADMVKAYEVFGNASKENALKMMITV